MTPHCPLIETVPITDTLMAGSMNFKSAKMSLKEHLVLQMYLIFTTLELF